MGDSCGEPDRTLRLNRIIEYGFDVWRYSTSTTSYPKELGRAWEELESWVVSAAMASGTAPYYSTVSSRVQRSTQTALRFEEGWTLPLQDTYGGEDLEFQRFSATSPCIKGLSHK